MTSSSQATEPPTPDLQSEVHALLTDVTVVLNREGREDLLKAINQEAQRQASLKPVVVVAGETQQGKSSLINSLLSWPDASPVRTGVTTSACIIFHTASTPGAKVYLVDKAEPKDIALSEISEWATVEKNPRNEKRVRWVAAGLNVPILTKLTLVDTPGVGGLDNGYADLALEALNADALIFVVGAGAPISSPELKFLRRVAERIDTLLLVLTHIDCHRGWPTIASDDLVILKERAPELAHCTLVPVSNDWAGKALAFGESSEGKEFHAEAGISQLESILVRQVVERAQSLKSANLSRLCCLALADIENSLIEREALARQADPALKKAMEAEQIRQRELQSDKANWPIDLDFEMKKIDFNRSDRLRQGIKKLRNHYEGLTDRARQMELEGLPQQLKADLESLVRRLAKEDESDLLKAASSIWGTLDEESPLTATFAMPVTGVPMGDDETFRPRARAVKDYWALIGNFNEGGAAVGGAFGPVGIILGAVVTGVAITLGRSAASDQARRSDFKEWMTRLLEDTQSHLENKGSRAMLEARKELGFLIRSRLETREMEIGAALERFEQATKEDRWGRVKSKKAVGARLAGIRELEVRAAELLSILRSTSALKDSGVDNG